jgi:geranylgeranyl pyrophosphate synthase
VDKFRELIEQYGLAEEIQIMADDYFSKAKEMLQKIKENDYTAYLLGLTDYIQNRQK